MEVALIEHAEHDVDGHQRGQEQQRLVGQRGLEGLRRALEAGVQAGGQAEFALGGGNGGDRLAQGDAGGKVEGKGDGRELALVIDGQRGGGGREVGEGTQWHLGATGRAHVEVLERLRILPKSWRYLHHNMILV